MSARPVRAAGGVVWRVEPDGSLLVLVVHRPSYDDWSFPKGKLDPGETFEDAARRELHEETGYHVELGPELGTAEYVDHRGRPKVVRYWEMTEAAFDGFAPNDEIDEQRWIAPDAARSLLSYGFDRDLLEVFVERHDGR